MNVNRYSRYEIIEEKKNVIVRIIYTYNFKNYKTLIKERSSFFSKIKPLIKKRKTNKLLSIKTRSSLSLLSFTFLINSNSISNSKNKKRLKEKSRYLNSIMLSRNN